MSNLSQITQKSKWLFNCMVKSIDQERLLCPNCRSKKSKIIDTKFVFSQLRECANCQLRYRTPTDNMQDNSKYYQSDYSLGFTTNIPEQYELEQLLNSKFENHEKSYKDIISILQNFYPEKIKVFDFGCSWGYGSWQLREAGFIVSAYEISQPRANYASEKLGIDIVDISKPPNEIDIFFSNHVIEHVPSPSQTIALARKMLKPDGIFIAITPNGSDSCRNADFMGWHQLWGQNHPNHLNDKFYEYEFRENPYLISSVPCNSTEIVLWNKEKSQIKFDCNSSELLVIAYPNMQINNK